MKNALNGLLGLAAFSTLVTSSTMGVPVMAQDHGHGGENSADFSLKLFRTQAASNEKNVLLSPFSAYEALCMTANGAVGSTLNQMATVLGARTGPSVKAPMAALNKRNKEVLAALNAKSGVQLEIANAIYADDKTKFRPEFFKLCADIYGAEARNEDFADPQTVVKINKWCDTKTHGKIKEILQKLTPNEKMVLLNSVYFKGAWEKAFKPDETKNGEFKLLTGGKKQVPMMHKTTEMGYFKYRDMQAVSLPYKGGRQKMYIFLPEPGADFAAFKMQFTTKNWDYWLPGFTQQKVRLTMPKYKVEFSTDLSKSLKVMGMAEAFSDHARFENMFADQAANISRVLQKTFMEVNEEGTEAAAVTAVVMMARAAAVEPPIPEFTVDRPFVVALVDEPTQEILFIGSIVNP